MTSKITYHWFTFMGHEICEELQDYNIFCPRCVSMYIDGKGLNNLDWFDEVDRCSGCIGLNRSPIPTAEVMSIRKIEIEQ